jgi:hypothetical protein
MACQAKSTVYWFSLMLYRGEYCNQSSFYCNGSASPFWCAVNGLNNTCSRAPDGNFTCSCRAGFSGEHCELSGTACGDGYCYNGAACTGGGICDCPDDWQGSANCSISTPEDLHSSGHHGIKVHSHSEALFYIESCYLEQLWLGFFGLASGQGAWSHVPKMWLQHPHPSLANLNEFLRGRELTITAAPCNEYWLKASNFIL